MARPLTGKTSYLLPQHQLGNFITCCIEVGILYFVLVTAIRHECNKCEKEYRSIASLKRHENGPAHGGKNHLC